MTRKILAIVIALMLLATGAMAAVSVPEPDEDLFYVYDGADVLSEETEAQIYYNNVNLFEACEAEIVFVVVDDTDGYSLEDFSGAIFDKWALYERDVLVVLSIEDEDYWMLQGSSIEREMTGSTMRALLEDYLEPDFAKQDYDAGVRKLFDALFAEVVDIYNADIKLVDGAAEHKSAAVQNASGSLSKSDRETENGGSSREAASEKGGINWGVILLIIGIILVLNAVRSSKKRRTGSKTVIVNPTPRTPNITRTIFTSPRPGSGPGGFTTGSFGSRSSTRSGGFGGRVGGGSTTRRSGGFGGGTGRSTSSRSGGFGGRTGGGRSGGGGSRGGGVGRGR